ncbi:MAG TPA: hypothetical protein VFN29_13660 [Chiayiivirga sp.]|nr:hypothetical protein [Chiayiivirga sp.]
MHLRALLILIIAATMVACSATGPTKPATDVAAGAPTGSAEEIVSHNAKARWDALVAKDVAKAYGYLTPGTRAAQSKEAYSIQLMSATINWTGANVTGVKCEDENVCSATVMVTYKVAGAAPGMGQVEGFAPVVEKWLHSGGEWFFLPTPAQ